MSITVYPLNNITYNAEDAMLQTLPYSSGVYGQTGNFNLTTQSNMKVKIGAGLAYMRIATAKGFTIYMNAQATLTFDAADSTLDRIDRIVLKWKSSSNAVTLEIVKGTPSSTPTAPTRNTSASEYDLVLYDVRVAGGATAITASMITDQRLNGSLCGLMANNITQIDTSTINNQIVALVNNQQSAINTQVTSAVNTAMAAAKSSGDFDGADGYTPVKGTDYWTQADQTSIVNQVLAAFNDVSEVGQ